MIQSNPNHENDMEEFYVFWYGFKKYSMPYEIYKILLEKYGWNEYKVSRVDASVKCINSFTSDYLIYNFDTVLFRYNKDVVYFKMLTHGNDKYLETLEEQA